MRERERKKRGIYKRFILRIVSFNEGRERLLGAKDRAGEIGFEDRLVSERDAEDRMGVWDAVEGNIVVFGRRVEEGGECVGLALSEAGGR